MLVNACVLNQWRIQDSGHQPLRWECKPIILAISTENCIKLKTKKRAGVPGAPLDPPLFLDTLFTRVQTSFIHSLSKPLEKLT